MSATPIPTKTAGQRPPVLPPVATTFDGASDGDDRFLERLRDDVRMICRHADAAGPDGLETLLDLVDRRRRLVLSEIWAYTATDGEPMALPPLRGLPLDYLIERPTREQRILQALVDQLDECHARCGRRLARHRFEVRLSQDLGTSEG